MGLPATLDLTWNANPPADAVWGYKVYLNGTLQSEPVAPAATLTVPAVGVYVVAVSAVNHTGEGPKAILHAVVLTV